jgi:hypothetical protein
MATYKVLQDIEAEDKLLGPLSLRQFLYAAIVAILGFISFKLVFIQPLLITPLAPPMILFGILAAPFGHDQSSEIWLLAKVRFAIKPRIRIWDQDGLQELVTVTAPKHEERQLTNGLDPTQVRSRLQALAETIDTRGWAIKGLNVNLATQPMYGMDQTDRLVDASTLIPDTTTTMQEVDTTDDIFDTQNNPMAQHLAQMSQSRDDAHKQAVLAQMDQQIRMQQQNVNPGPSSAAAPALPTLDDQMLLAQMHRNQALSREQTYGNTRVLEPSKPSHQPSNHHAAHNKTDKTPHQPVTAKTNPVILNDVDNNDPVAPKTDGGAHRNNTQLSDDEVVVSLR